MTSKTEVPTNTPAESSQATDVSWTSAFQAACWISPLYYSTTIDVGNSKDAITKSPQQRKEESEVFGWTLDAAARGVAVMGTAVFVSTELLRLAEEAAGCEVSDYDDDIVDQVEAECTNRVYGMRPSSILTNIVMVVGLFSACVMPLVGSIIDHTPHRRAVGSVSAAALSVFILLQMLVMEKFWFLAAILQVLVAFAYTVHLCAVYAYLPELTTNHETMVQYTARFSAAQYSGSVSFLILMVFILSLVNGNEQFMAAMLSQTVVFIVCALCFGYAWTELFWPRPARHIVPVGRSLLSAGFWKVYKTGQTILEHHSAIKWLLLSVSFTEAATTTFSTVAITYMTHTLGFTSRQNGMAILILLLFGIPGTRLAAWLTKRYNPIRSLQACLLLWIVNTTAAAIVLKGPGQEGLAYFFAMIWGLAIGWVYPSEKTLYVTIIPRGQEAELMGVYIFACQALSWLPPLVFTIMNEMGVSMRIALFALTFYFMISFCILFWVGDYSKAVLHAKEIHEGRLQFAASPQNGLGIDAYGCYQEWVEGDTVTVEGDTVTEAGIETVQTEEEGADVALCYTLTRC
jgi:UMF1 family MFS transporter